MSAYTWNLVRTYPTDFTVIANEIHPDGKVLASQFHCKKGFEAEADASRTVRDGIILDEETFLVRTAFLDHKIPVLAFCFEEKNHVNIMKNKLQELGLAVGPWLKELKRAVLGGTNDELAFRVWWKDSSSVVERYIKLGQLKREILTIVPGQKICYVTDTAHTPQNAERIVELAQDADYLFIEACFLHEDSERAQQKYHLTARQAGRLGKEARAARVVPFHFSPKYIGLEERIYKEVEEEAQG